MSRLSQFCEDPISVDTYPTHSSTNKPPPPAAIRARCIEWPASGKHLDGTHNAGVYDLDTFSDLLAAESRSSSWLRVLFLQSWPGTTSEAEGFAQLASHFSIPSTVFTGERRSVSYGFCTAKAPAGDADIAWCYFMSAGESPVVVPRLDRKPSGSTWIRSFFFLHARPNPRRNDTAGCVTLLCFGTQDCLVSRFARLQQNPAWKDVLQEPCLLFDIIYEELFVLEDDLAWRLAGRFRNVEQTTLGLARQQDELEMNVDFFSLHDISRGCVFMLESLEGAMLTLETLTNHLKISHASTSAKPLTNAVIQALEHRQRTFHSTSMRLNSLDKRIQNIIGLSFNLVTQSDSRVMKADSRAMKVIAVLTLVFLPATGVASIFSMPFFNVDFDGSSRDLQAATSFWIFWVVVLPLTALVVAGWFWWYKLAKRQRKREMLSTRDVRGH